MASHSNPNPHKPVNHTTENPTPSLASTDSKTAEEQCDGIVLGEKATNNVNSASSVGIEPAGESTESNGLISRDSEESGVEAAEVAEESREEYGVGLEVSPRCNSVTEGTEESGERDGGVLEVIPRYNSITEGLRERDVVEAAEVAEGLREGNSVGLEEIPRCNSVMEGAEESREQDGVVLEDIPRYNSTTVGEGDLRELWELSGVKLGESGVVVPEADLQGIGLGDEVVEELTGRQNIEGVEKDLASEEMPRDSDTVVMQALMESRESSRVDSVDSGIVTLAADSQGMVSGDVGFSVEDKVVEDLAGRQDFEGVSEDLGSSIEAEEPRELNGAVKEEIPKDLATEVAQELEEQRQLNRIDLSRFEVSTVTDDLRGIVSGVSGFSVDEKVVVESRKIGDLEGEVVELRDSLEGGEAVLARTCSELEVEEAPLSPNSSGYAGERGSSSSSIGASEIDEIQESKSVDFVVGNQRESASGSQQCFGKGHKDEDDAFISWRKRKKHFLILSHSGKPIFSRYGDEHKLAGFSATLQAIISFVENGRDRVKSVRAGNHQVVFLVKGPIYLVCISCTEEPYESLKGQLELLYGQMILILTKSVNKCFEKNPKFDMTPLLGGTDAVFSSLIHSFNRNPATFLHAYTCVPLAYATRQAVGAILQEVANSDVLFSLIMCKHKVVSLAGAQKASLHPDDMLLLANFVVSSESFRTSEAFSPICLPRYNPFAFLHAYVHYFDEDIYLMMLTTSSEAFYHLKNCRMRIEAVLLQSNVLSEVHRSMMDGGMRIEDVPVDRLSRPRSLSHVGCHEAPSDSLERNRELASAFGGAAGLLHFIYRSVFLEQYVSSEFASPVNSLQQQKRLYRAYQKLSLSVHHRETSLHKTHFRRDENYVLLCWVTQEFEFYAAFDSLADKASAIKICNRVCQWVKDVETDIFLLGGSSFSW